MNTLKKTFLVLGISGILFACGKEAKKMDREAAYGPALLTNADNLKSWLSAVKISEDKLKDAGHLFTNSYSYEPNTYKPLEDASLQITVNINWALKLKKSYADLSPDEKTELQNLLTEYTNTVDMESKKYISDAGFKFNENDVAHVLPDDLKREISLKYMAAQLRLTAIAAGTP